MENGYEEKPLRRIIDDYQPNVNRERDDTQKFVSLPYVSTISNKLKTAFKKAGYTTMFKSGRNLSTILTSRNKPQLPRNSFPGVYRVPCKCKGNYIGHTGKKILTRGNQHEKAVFNGNYKDSALSEHTKDCQAGIEWENMDTISTEPQYYRRAIREALEIQREEVSEFGTNIINLEAGQYVVTDTWRPTLKKIGRPKSNSSQLN